MKVQKLYYLSNRIDSLDFFQGLFSNNKLQTESMDGTEKNEYHFGKFLIWHQTFYLLYKFINSKIFICYEENSQNLMLYEHEIHEYPLIFTEKQI